MFGSLKYTFVVVRRSSILRVLLSQQNLADSQFGLRTNAIDLKAQLARVIDTVEMYLGQFVYVSFEHSQKHTVASLYSPGANALVMSIS